MENDNQELKTQEEVVAELDKKIKLGCSSIITVLFFIIGSGSTLFVIWIDDDPWAVLAIIYFSPCYFVGLFFSLIGLYVDSDSKICALGLLLNGFAVIVVLLLYFGG